MRQGRWAAVATAGIVLAGAALAACGASPRTSGAPDAAEHTGSNASYPTPIRVTNLAQVSARVTDLTMSTPALSFPVHVAVLLPTGYAQHPQKRYPVIYFLHGGSAGPNTGHEYLNWLQAGNIQQITGDDQVIEVFPQGDTGGWYTNWAVPGKRGAPQWETFHVDQLVPFIDHTYRTIVDRSQCAVVGLSMGGYGAMEYAARHPDLFGTAVSLSGAPDLANPPQLIGPTSRVIVGAMAVGNGGTPDSPFGSFDTDLVNWRDHDPADLAVNLRHTHLFLSVGNGKPGPLDTPATLTPFGQTIEGIVDQSTTQFEQILARLGIPATQDNYGNGTHSWAYWQREIAKFLPAVMADFQHPSAYPASITYTTADPTYARWDWTVAFDRTAEAFSTLADASRAGFQLSGGGQASVRTPGYYKAGSAHAATITDQRGVRQVQLTADHGGRLTVGLHVAGTVSSPSATVVIH